MMPFLTSYDPPGSSEGTLDPLGLYQIADQLAVRLVPAIRERMQRVRFLTAMAVGAVVTDSLDANPEFPDAPPFLVWEWLVVEALIRSMNDEGVLWGVPGTLVTRNALGQHGYLDLRSYLKTPRIFGFHGVYKRLANHLGILDVHLSSRPEAERLVDAWARSVGLGGLEDSRPLLDKWRAAVQRSLSQSPPRTRTGWTKDDWLELATLLAPHRAGRRERNYLSSLLHADDERSLKALPTIWRLQNEFANDVYQEEALHQRLAEELPRCETLLSAIRSYELFARSMQDAFDLLRAEATRPDAQGYEVPSIATDADFATSHQGLDFRYQEAHLRLSEVDLQLVGLFDQRFSRFAQPLQSADFALALCDHHEAVQKAKSASGKRAWFDRLSPQRVYIRHQYRQPRQPIQPDRYLHDYRGRPIRNFFFDLA